MKKMIGMVALCVVGLSVASATVRAEAPAVETAVVAAPAAQDVTVKGTVSVVNEADGALKAIYINPAEGHGYKVDIVNGEGKTLADKNGKVVEVVGVDANKLFTIKSVTVAE